MESREEQINIRVTKKEKERIKYLSEKLGYKNLGEYVRKSSLNLENRNEKIKEIYTLTLNPAVDMVLNISEFKDLNKYSNSEVKYFSGGKGINVSKIINQFNVPTTILHYSGGFTGNFIKETLDKENLNQIMFKGDQPTRINIKLNIDNEETKEINGFAEFISEKLQL